MKNINSLFAVIMFAFSAVVIGCEDPSFLSETQSKKVIEESGAVRIRESYQARKEKALFPENRFRIRRIVILQSPIGGKRLADLDILGRMMNFFHAHTRPEIIRQDLLFGEGDITNLDILYESERVLYRSGLYRDLEIYWTEVPPEDRSPDTGIPEVDVYIRAQDSFSFFSQINGGVQSGNPWSRFQLGDNNLFGRGYRAMLDMYYDQYESRLFQRFRNTRLNGSRWTLSEKTGMYFDDKKQFDGYSADASLSYPLYSAFSKWGYTLSYSHTDRVVKTMSGNRIAVFRGTDIARHYSYKNRKSETYLTRSFGKRAKLNVSAGFGGWFTRNAPKQKLNDAQAEFFDNEEPDRGDIYILGMISAYDNHYIRIRNHRYLVLTEYLRKGPYARYRTEIGRTMDRRLLWQQRFQFGYNLIELPLHIIQPSFTVSIRQEGIKSYDVLYRAGLGYYFRNAGPGVLHLSAGAAEIQRRKYREPFYSLDRFYGYTYNQFSGNREWTGMMEYYSYPRVVSYFAFSGVVFYQMESIGASDDPIPEPVSSVGGGVRFIIPDMRSGVFYIFGSYPFNARNLSAQRMISFGYGSRF